MPEQHEEIRNDFNRLTEILESDQVDFLSADTLIRKARALLWHFSGDYKEEQTKLFNKELEKIKEIFNAKKEASKDKSPYETFLKGKPFVLEKQTMPERPASEIFGNNKPQYARSTENQIGAILVPRPTEKAKTIYNNIADLKDSATYADINAAIDACVGFKKTDDKIGEIETLQMMVLAEALIEIRGSLQLAQGRIFVKAEISTDEERAALRGIKEVSALFAQGSSEKPPSFNVVIKAVDDVIKTINKNRSSPILNNIKSGLALIFYCLAALTVVSIVAPVFFGYIGEKLSISAEKAEKYESISQKMHKIKSDITENVKKVAAENAQEGSYQNRQGKLPS